MAGRTTANATCLWPSPRLAQVRDKADEVEASVAVDCSTFDRVLMYLEASAKGLGDTFTFDANCLEEVAEAAHALGCRPLAERTSQARATRSPSLPMPCAVACAVACGP